MSEVFCSFCGVVFGVFTDLYEYDDDINEDEVDWTKHCILIYAEKDTSPPFALSGTTQDWLSVYYGDRRIPPTGYDDRGRWKDRRRLKDADVTSWLKADLFTTREFEIGGENLERIAYPIHALCWSIFLQQYSSVTSFEPSHVNNSDLVQALGAVLSAQILEPECGRGLLPDWCTDYCGPERFWEFTDFGWANDDTFESYNIMNEICTTPELDHLVFNPSSTFCLDNLLANPPILLSSAQGIQATDRSVRLQACGDQQCGLQALPEELRIIILCLLPSASVAAVRLASRAMATTPLVSTFWLSRFDYPHEFSYIESKTAPQLRDRKAATIDWPSFYAILKQEKDGEARGWENRRRIARLCQQLCKRLLTGTPLVHREKPVKPVAEEDTEFPHRKPEKNNNYLLTWGLLDTVVEEFPIDWFGMT